MKIEFEFNSSYKGKLTIDGKEMEIAMYPGLTRLTGLTDEERENTLGGIVAMELYSKLADSMQAWAEADEIDCDVGMWTELSESAAYAAGRRF